MPQVVCRLSRNASKTGYVLKAGLRIYWMEKSPRLYALQTKSFSELIASDPKLWLHYDSVHPVYMTSPAQFDRQLQARDMLKKLVVGTSHFPFSFHDLFELLYLY